MGESLADLYRYAAFVSYASKDAKFARALHRQLERYVIPGKLGTFDLTGGGKKNRVYPVFRDREELPAGDLGANLEAALRASAALIVICSPNAALSPWVEKEIQYFISLGRADRIFAIIAETAPVLIDGKDATRNSFPRPFRTENGGSLDLIAADARKGKDGFRNAWLKLIAGLIGVNAGSLQDRDRKRRRARRLAWGASLGILTAASGLTAWAMVLPYETYAKDYTRVFGVWHPVTQISEADASAREVSFRFVQRGALGPVMRVDRVNGKGYCPLETNNSIVSLTGDAFSFDCNTARACSARLSYANGLLASEEIIDQFGNPLEQIKYSSGGAQAIREEAVIGCSRVGNGIKFITIDRAADGPNKGQDIYLQFFAGPGEPAANKAYAFGYRYVYDAEKRRVRTIALDRDGGLAMTSAGWAAFEMRRDASGDVQQWLLRDENENLVNGSDGWARQDVKRDPFGNAVDVSNFDYLGAPVPDKNGVHVFRHSFDNSGQTIRSEFFGTNGEPTTNKSGYARIDLQHDAMGYSLAVFYFDDQGKLVPEASTGCYGLQRVREQDGTQLLERCLGPNREPLLEKEGYSLARLKMDLYGNRIEEAYYGLSNEPVFQTDGYHLVKYEWNAVSPGAPINLRVGTAFFGIDLEPVVSRGNRIHAIRDAYDPNGYSVSQSYLGPDGQPTPDERGVYSRQYRNDRVGKKIEYTPLGPEGNPIDSPGQSFIYKRDEFGRIIEETYTAPGGERAVFDGKWRYTMRYDAMGRIVERANFDIDDQPLPSGLAVEQREYDSWGREKRRLFKNAAGQPAPGPEGAAVLEYRRDVRGNVIEYLYFGVDGRPALGEDGWSVQKRIVDPHGRTTGGLYFGVNGEPIEINTGAHGWRSIYDIRGNRIEFAYLGLDGQPKVLSNEGDAAIFRYKYDLRDLLVETMNYDASGQPAADENDWFGVRFELNERGDIIVQYSLGSDGNPVQRIEFDRGPRGETIEERWFGPDGQPRSDSYFRTVLEYDRLGNETLLRLYNLSGDLVKSASTGRAIVKSSYNALGKKVAEEAFGAQQEPVDRTDLGWHRKDIQYTEAGAWVAEVCSRVDNSVVPCK